MRRRDFIAGFVGAVAVRPLPLRAQQAVPVVGFLASSSAKEPSGPVAAVHLALKQAGYDLGQTVRMEYRYAENRLERLPALAAELASIPATVIVTSGGPPVAHAAKAATSTIPIVFAPVSDPVRNGLVESLNRPGGNITGIAALTIELDAKRLELLNELVRAKGPLGVLFNSTRPDSGWQVDSIKAAAQTVGRDVILSSAHTTKEIDDAFSIFLKGPVVGVLVAADAFFSAQRKLVVAQVARHGWPAIYQWREFAEIGGLASFGPSLFDSYRRAGLLAARILKGEKPADLPVEQPTKFEFVLNLKTAKALGLTVPLPLLGRADEVIE